MIDPVVQRLLDEQAIGRGLATAARLLDAKRWDELASVFAPDIVFDYGAAGEERGIEALTANMRRFLDRCGPTQHLIGSVIVDLDPAGWSAVSRAYVQARHQRAGDRGGPVFDACGEYVDRWERRPGGWRIVRRDALWQTHSGDPAVIGAAPAQLG